MSIDATLITPTPPDISAFGIRSISSFLRQNGCNTRLIFLPGSIGLLKEGGKYVYAYDKTVIDDITALCSQSSLIGISFMSSYFDRAVQIAQALKKTLNIPLIMGGIHPSCKPQEALKYADMACVGEGEEALLELLNNMKTQKNHRTVQGIWFKDNGNIIKNNVRALIKNLDSLPFFDYSNKEHYIYNKKTGHIEELNDTFFKETLPLLPSLNGSIKRAYRTMTDRGCPHKCSYCNISNLKRIYEDDTTPYFRARSVDSVIAELTDMKSRFPFVEAVQFFDDTFFARPFKQIEDFSIKYKEKIILPFYVQASPTTLTEDKLTTLIDAGLVFIEMGIQTGSEKIKKLYRRQESNEKIIEGTKIINKYKEKLIIPDYHIIIDNPWEDETDTMDTVKLLYNIPKPFGLCISSLVFFPGTDLYEKAVTEGLIKDEISDVYRKPFYMAPQKTYSNFLIYLLTFQHFPRPLLSLLVNRKAAKTASKLNLSPLFGLSYKVGEGVRFLAKVYSTLKRRDWRRIKLFINAIIEKDPVVAGRKS
ncbi:cobalamin-binding protein [Candidatus Magnetoovum chiemensis]|nr:cobalamin-binding protein [Candidatus Magnetoovum chiemensis]